MTQVHDEKAHLNDALGDKERDDFSRAPEVEVQGPETVEEANKPEEPEVPSFLAKPDKADVFLLVALLAMTVYNFALIPLRAWLLTQPVAYTLMVGGYTSAVVSGANASAGNGHWLMYMFFMLLGVLKFVPIYYFLGRKWGKEFIDMSLQYLPRAKKLFDRTVTSESLGVKAGTLGFLPLGLLPGPVPFNIVNAVTGLLKIPFWFVMVCNALSVIVVNGTMLYLGYTYGEPVLDVVDVISKYMLWITLALVVVMVFQARRQMKQQKLG